MQSFKTGSHKYVDFRISCYLYFSRSEVIIHWCVQVSGEGVLDAAAVQFCARKVSAVSGDARKVLDICR